MRRLVLIQLTAKAEVSHTLRFLLRDNFRVTLHIVDVLPCAERCAHWGTNEK